MAERQVDLSDRTQDALALSAAPDVDATAEAAPLVAQEQGLAEQTLAIANALEQQSGDAGGVAGGDPQAAEATQQLRAAADHVMIAHGEMEDSVAGLSAPSDLEAARGAQDRAVEELALALEILEPPGQGGGGESPQQQPGSDGQQQQAGGAEEETEVPSEADSEQAAGPTPDPGQLLQEVRDREAKRRRDRANRQSGYETVEKDW